jgi:uncharacterized protein YvpB/LysM repeat protein
MQMIKRVFRTLALLAILILLDVSSARGDELPDSAYITGVIGHAQKHNLSCEARSAADLAAYWGVSLGENEFLGVLPRADNPEQGFVGSLEDAWGNIPPHGYGVHAGPVAETLRSFGMQAEAQNHLSWDALRREVSAGRPVIVWIIGQMWTGKAIEYQSPDGSTSIVAAFEHTMILIGYDRATVQVVDSYTGQYQSYALGTFLDSWKVLGNMAVFSSGKGESQSTPLAELPARTYTVQEGEYLSELADRFGATLNELILLNDLPYPYTIYTGQVLQLPNRVDATPEPVTVQQAPVVRVVNFEVHLPLIQREYAVQRSSVNVNPLGVQATSTSTSSPEALRAVNYCENPGVDWAVLARLQKILMPTLVNNSDLLLR